MLAVFYRTFLAELAVFGIVAALLFVPGAVLIMAAIAATAAGLFAVFRRDRTEDDPCQHFGARNP